MFWSFWVDARVLVVQLREFATLPKKFELLINGKEWTNNGHANATANATAYLIPYAAPN